MPSTIAQNPLVVLPPISLDEVHWMELPNRFNDRTFRRLCHDLTDIEFNCLLHEVSVLATTIRRDMPIDIRDAELGRLFGHSGGWAQRMIVRYMQELHSDSPLT
jgi:hypothetical protein